jgi:hypothetical protein
MVYSGFILVYGIKMTCAEIAQKFGFKETGVYETREIVEGILVGCPYKLYKHLGIDIDDVEFYAYSEEESDCEDKASAKDEETDGKFSNIAMKNYEKLNAKKLEILNEKTLPEISNLILSFLKIDSPIFEYISFDSQRCCYADSENVFIGVDIGNYDVVYRSSIESYDDITIFHKEYTDKLDALKKYYTNNEKEIKYEFEKLAELYLIEGEPRFYSFANDCESCT